MNTRNLVAGFFMVTALLGEGAIAASCPSKGVSVTVLARGPAGLRIEGKGCELSVEEDATALTFKVPLAPIETGIGLRDLHMRELLETEKYPVATLRVARSGLTFPKEHGAVEGTADAELTLHGQSRPVKVRYRAEASEGGVTQVRGSFQLDLRDFDLRAPSYLGVSVAPGVEVIAELAVHGP
jgi:polyisoprenoid-binding protein YceI